MKSERAARRFFLALLFGSIGLLAFVLFPLAEALFMAAVLAGALWPLNVRLARKIRNKRQLAAGILTGAVVVLLVTPVVGLSAFLIGEATAGVKFITSTIRSEGVTGLIDRAPGPLKTLGQEVLKRVPVDDPDASIGSQVTEQGGKAAGVVASTLSAGGSLVFQIAMMLIALFFLLAEGEQLIAWLDEALPLRAGQTRELLSEFRRVSYAVLMSTVITSAVQAAAALAGYLIARVPHPIFFTVVTFFVAFIPAVGAGSVCLTAAALLFVTGHSWAALFLGIWGIVVVGLVDNAVKPLLIKGGVEMDGAVVFFSLIGGLAAFGATGLLLGPLVVSGFLALMRMYRRDFSVERPAEGDGPVGAHDEPRPG